MFTVIFIFQHESERQARINLKKKIIKRPAANTRQFWLRFGVKLVGVSLSRLWCFIVLLLFSKPLSRSLFHLFIPRTYFLSSEFLCKPVRVAERIYPCIFSCWLAAASYFMPLVQGFLPWGPWLGFRGPRGSDRYQHYFFHKEDCVINTLCISYMSETMKCIIHIIRKMLFMLIFLGKRTIALIGFVKKKRSVTLKRSRTILVYAC